MAISPPSDIVLDVARAAGPADIEAARAALAKRAGAADGGGSTFSVGEMAASRGAGTAEADPSENYRRFEAMVLQTFIQTMMPKDTQSVYGKGFAGDMWKSQLAERLADVMAERGGIGIARSMLADHYLEGKRVVPVGTVSGGPEQAAIDEQAQLSTSLIHELQRRLVRVLDAESTGAGSMAKT